ncbi:MAG: hypothetical protein COT45_04945 [bacterium (Candidatus Stahlbacteria) CG08_land_8_20_14_0_20_40_26]|nr:MAG: hypothetical protein COX49_03110 [bacterium (Candidatus Stahlbacteria) CG23_combo_of_CG06-09_8_20_14_all_40_9]PIS23947.1 MAG: hypothetical protein COT45_04945 [bacterium (Candidatus Stahlbacteria) CG08_land_8_20_14_0_20_40_26]
MIEEIKEIAESFKKLFNLYMKSEYNLELLSKEDTESCISYAEKILEVYSQFCRWHLPCAFLFFMSFAVEIFLDLVHFL